MIAVLYVALGGALGAMARYGVHQAMSTWEQPFPWSTVAINMAGSGVVGLLAGLWAGRDMGQSPERLVLMVGFLGAFTTFSTFANESTALLRAGQWGWFALHGVLHNGLSMGAALLGWGCVYAARNHNIL